MRRAAAAAVLGLALAARGAAAGTTERAEIRFEGRTYSYTFTALLDGSSEAVRAVVTDYDRLGRINDDIIESRVLERYGPGHLKRVLRMKHCLLVFCFDFDFVETVEETGERIATTIVPQESNFEDGVAEWRIEPVGERATRITVHATQTPGFWIPPVIGPFLLKRVFIKEINETCVNIERLAQERDA